MIESADKLRLVDMAKSDVAGRREGIGRKGLQCAHIDLAHRFIAAGAHCGQMAGGNDGQQFALAGLYLLLSLKGCGIHTLVGGRNRGLQCLLLVLRALSGLALLHITWTDEGQGADDAARLAGRAAQRQRDHMPGLVAGRADHLGAQVAQQLPAFIEHADRVMIAGQQQQGCTCIVQAHDELVVQLACIAGWGSGVEDVASDQHGIHGMGLDLGEQPVDQGLMLGLTAAAHEVLAQMPVGGMEKTHAAMVCQPAPVLLAIQPFLR